jgi:hypothetical protein
VFTQISPLEVALRTADGDHVQLLLDAGEVVDIDSINYMGSYEFDDDVLFERFFTSVSGKNLREEVKSKLVEVGLKFEKSREKAIILLEGEAHRGKITRDNIID